MSTWAEWSEAFSIFARYSNGGDYDEVCAEHDEIFAGPEVKKVSPADLQRLQELGWKPDDSGHFRKFV